MDERRTAGFQTLTTIRALLEEAGCTPRKRHGQHFLIDGNLMRKLVDSAELGPDDCVLEVGPGTGSLTGLLARRAGRVIAVEIDPALAAIVRRITQGLDNVRVIEADALAGKSALAPDLLAETRAVSTARSRAAMRLKLAANLPYDIATPLVMCLVQSDLPLVRLCFTVQAEVGQRFCAGPGTGAYGAVGIVAQAWGNVSQICKVPAEAFWPRPKVESAMIRIDPIPPSRRRVVDMAAFSAFVRSFFQHRRKTMSHIARRLTDSQRVLDAMQQLDMDARSRPEELSVSQWESLFEASR